ncbi:hypothetical protein ACFYW8_22665 [Streptomyces sp. NPDC002742]|uniref:SCO2400 family protein n=1 Tax=Streptomyces sp. NPDC002742 TaxID=3364663 RepID=UPI0036837000
MDYCHVCRRHLNGALACPGCGTPVDELGADAEDADARPEPGADAYRGEDGGTEGRAARRRGGRGRDAGSPGGAQGPDAPAGTSRRDRKAAAHRRRRRRTLYVAVGFVLAAGGLSLAELGVDAPGLGPGPAAAGGESPDGSASSAASSRPKSSPSGSASATRESGSSSSPSGSAPVSASASPAAAGEKSAGGGSASAGTLPGRSASAPATGSSNPRTSAPATTAPTTSAPTPTPSSSDACNHVLWWCA